jgi:hypothetical protein
MNDQFNGNTEKRHPPPHLTGHEVYEMVKNVQIILGKQKMNGENTEEDYMWKKQSIFWKLPYWKDLDVRHSIDVMHIEKNVCERLLETLLNTDGKTMNHGHARVDLKKMGIRQELCLDDSVKGTELSTSCITLSKHEEFCGFLKNVKVSSVYSTNVSRHISFLDLKVAPGVKSHDYHILLTQMRHYRNKKMLVIPFNTGNHWVTLSISTKYDRVWYCDSLRQTDPITGDRLTRD